MSEFKNLLIKTIGVYGSTEESFFNSLKNEQVDLFCDIRQRRAVRGSKYSYVNSTKLQQKLAEVGIRYIHIKELAPTTEIRNLQKSSDKKLGVLKSVRTELSTAFREGYDRCCVDHFDFRKFLASLPKEVRTICFFCVEKEPVACHRSIVADHLQKKFDLEVKHIQ